MSEEVIKSIISAISVIAAAAVPTLATVLTTKRQNKEHRRNAAKQSILQMILEDKVSWNMDKEFPTNYGRICDEYEIYHRNGGNGEVTKKVEEYKAWYVDCEKSLKKGEIDG